MLLKIHNSKNIFSNVFSRQKGSFSKTSHKDVQNSLVGEKPSTVSVRKVAAVKAVAGVRDWAIMLHAFLQVAV